MLSRPFHISSPPDVRAPDFLAQYAAWKNQMCLEMDTMVAGTRKNIAESKALMAEVDRLLKRP